MANEKIQTLVMTKEKYEEWISKPTVSVDGCSSEGFHVNTVLHEVKEFKDSVGVEMVAVSGLYYEPDKDDKNNIPKLKDVNNAKLYKKIPRRLDELSSPLPRITIEQLKMEHAALLVRYIKLPTSSYYKVEKDRFDIVPADQNKFTHDEIMKIIEDNMETPKYNVLKFYINYGSGSPITNISDSDITIN